MANRAGRIATPILCKHFHKPNGENVTPTRTTAMSASREIRAALEAAEVAPCVIDDWANEPFRRRQMAIREAGLDRAKSYTIARTPNRRDLAYATRELQKMRDRVGDAMAAHHARNAGGVLAFAAGVLMLHRRSGRGK